MASSALGYAVMWCDFLGVWSLPFRRIKRKKRFNQRRFQCYVIRYRMAIRLGRWGRCAICGTAENLTIDHVVPKSRGGSNHVENWAVLCSECNRAKSNRFVREIEAMAIGPVAVAVLLCGGEANGG